ncbi:MAG: hypothetical protein ABR958_06790 [Dehalococcoidales bacterium]
MNMVKIVCPKCGAEGKLSLVETSYVGPRRCWKCRGLFTITIENNRVTSSEPLNEEEFQKQMEAKATKEGITNLRFTHSAQDDDIPRLSPERRRDYNQPLHQPSNQPPSQPPVQAEPEKPKTLANPPDRFRTFVPLEEPPSQKEPEKPKTPKSPPDRFRTFVPLEEPPSQKEPEKPKTPKNPPDRFRTFIPPAT